MMPGMRTGMLLLAAIASLAIGCSDEELPTAAELHGTWVGVDDVSADYRVFVFADVDDGSHPELAGMTDVYALYRYLIGDPPALIQTGHYEVAEVVLNENGEEVTDDALVTEIASDVNGTPPGTRYGNGIQGWTGDAFTLRSVSTSTGTLSLVRSTDGALP